MREEEELELADIIICPSPFVKNSLLGINHSWEKKIKIVPYGVRKILNVSKRFTTTGPLHILTAGKAGLRKGAPYVLEAAKELKGIAHFRWVGDYSHVHADVAEELKAHIDMTGQVNRDEMAHHYAWADIFLLPSICEGSATVTYEAMQYGVPCLVTNNTGSIIRDGMDGFIIETGSSVDMIQKILYIIRHRERLDEFNKNIQTQSVIGSFDMYTERIKHIIQTIGS
jgi:glycosyltransferase involved in cell wall biosynthesis